jgi:hypothetical protein
MSQNEAERIHVSDVTKQSDVQDTNAADNASKNEADGMRSSGESHKMSIAIVIGSTIGAIGLVLLLYGLFGGTSYAHSDGININLWWGLLMVAFGIIMAGGNYLFTRMRTQATAK